MGTKNKGEGSSFVKQAGILAAAGIICRIIGLLYRSPLTGIIGETGNGYYAPAYRYYQMILLISSYSIPSAVSKVISQRLATHQYKNAQRIFHCSIIYVVVVGGIASLFAFFGADFLIPGRAAMVLRTLAPTIFFSGLLGVLRGYFQANRSMVQTSVSQILEQILNAAVSMLAAWGLMQIFAGEDELTCAAWGAVGSAVGTGVGVLIALAFMLMIYHMNRKIIRRRIERDRSRDLLETGEIFKIILFMVTPVLLSTFAYNASALINQTLYLNLMQSVHNASYDDITIINGIYDTEAVGLSNIPIAIASAMASAILPSIAGSFETKKKKDVRHKISVAIKTIMFIAIPSAVGMTVLSRPIVWLLYNTNTDSIRLGGCLSGGAWCEHRVLFPFHTEQFDSAGSRQGVEAGYKRGDCAGGADCGGGSPPDLYRYWYLQFADRRYGIFFYDVPVKWHRGEKSDRLSSGNREDVCPAAGILCDHGACGCRYLLWADADSAERISRQCGCTAAFGGNRRTDVFCGGVKAWRHVEKRTARNSRRQYDCEICGKIAFAEELGRKFVIEL